MCVCAGQELHQMKLYYNTDKNTRKGKQLNNKFLIQWFNILCTDILLIACIFPRPCGAWIINMATRKISVHLFTKITFRIPHVFHGRNSVLQYSCHFQLTWR